MELFFFISHIISKNNWSKNFFLPTKKFRTTYHPLTQIRKDIKYLLVGDPFYKKSIIPAYPSKELHSSPPLDDIKSNKSIFQKASILHEIDQKVLVNHIIDIFKVLDSSWVEDTTSWAGAKQSKINHTLITANNF